MNKDEVCIATIAWARNRDEENELRTSLTALSLLGLPVFITDGGSSESFVDFLKGLPGFTMLSAKGLWAQAKNSLAAAAKSGAKFILYAEPDKLIFFSKHLKMLLGSTLTKKCKGVVIASRSAAGFATFPFFQQTTESCINDCCKEVIGVDADYCYGPFLFNASLLPYGEHLPENIGWGWRPFLFAVAHRLGLPVEVFEGDFECPLQQKSADAKERLYRMKQLTQNIEGLLLATSIQLP